MTTITLFAILALLLSATIGLSIGYLVFLLNKTEFVLEYGSLLGLSKRLFKQEYYTWRTRPENAESGSYPQFLRETFPNFWTRLIGCPFCLCTFLSLVTGPLFLFTGGVASALFLAMNLLYKKIYLSQTG